MSYIIRNGVAKPSHLYILEVATSPVHLLIPNLQGLLILSMCEPDYHSPEQAAQRALRVSTSSSM